MSSTNTSTQDASLESETEPESYEADPEIQTDPESDPDREYYIENQLGLPYYQFGIYTSPSRPPVDPNNKLNDPGEFFSQRKVCESEFSS